MRRFKYMLWLLVAVFCLMPCGVSAAETQKDLKIQEVFQRYGKKRNVTMVELSNEMLETYAVAADCSAIERVEKLKSYEQAKYRRQPFFVADLHKIKEIFR